MIGEKRIQSFSISFHLILEKNLQTTVDHTKLTSLFDFLMKNNTTYIVSIADYRDQSATYITVYSLYI